jgi:hypothetical protein
MEDGCRNTDFDDTFDCVDFFGESMSGSSGMVLGNLASTAGRMGKKETFPALEGVKISESDADL